MSGSAKRTREKIVRVAVSDEEYDLIRDKMLAAGTTNFSAYARKMLLDGYIVRRDFSELKELVKQIAGIARNINQIARRANESRSVNTDMVESLRMYFYDIKRAVTERLVKMLEE